MGLVLCDLGDLLLWEREAEATPTQLSAGWALAVREIGCEAVRIDPGS